MADLAANTSVTQSEAMEVAVIFDPAFAGKTGRAVWIVDTPANRQWLDEQHDLDANSATFTMEQYSTADAAVVHMIRNVQEHHPAWGKIEVIGAVLTSQVTADLEGEGQFSETPTGFLLSRS